MTKKRFLDRKNALHFKLVHRSVRDLKTSTIGQMEDRELVPMNQLASERMSEIQQPSNDEVDISSFEHLDTVGEAAKYGIYFDDREYDYTKHLKNIGVAPGAIFIPAATNSALEAEEEQDEPEGDYNEEYDYDYDLGLGSAVKEVLEALDDEQYETADFDDDFVVAMDRDDTGVLQQVHYTQKPTGFDAGSTASDSESVKGIQYSPSVAITSIDNKFDAILRLYDGDESESLDEVEFSSDEGEHSQVANDQELNEALEDFIVNEREYIRASIPERTKAAICLLDEIRREMGPISQSVLNREESSTESDSLDEDSDDSHGALDCQSVIATLTNSDNLPGIIREARRAKGTGIIKISRRSGLPLADSIPELHEEGLNGKERVKINKGNARSREETAEDKRIRKAAIKLGRRERRSEKKENRVRFAADPISAPSTTQPLAGNKHVRFALDNKL